MSHPCPICGKDTNTPVCVICKLDPEKKQQVIEVLAGKSKNPPHAFREKAKLGDKAPLLSCESKKGYKEEDKDMSQKKECTTDGCNSPAQKDGLCYKCFKEEHGKAPYLSMDQPAKKQRLGPEKAKGHHSMCEAEGCKKYVVKDRLCYSHYKEKYGTAPFSEASGRKKENKRKYKKRPFDTAKMLDNFRSPAPTRGVPDNALALKVLKDYEEAEMTRECASPMVAALATGTGKFSALSDALKDKLQNVKKAVSELETLI